MLTIRTICLTIALLAVLRALTACHPASAPAPLPPAPAPLGDAGPADSCARACARLRALGCSDGQPTPQGASCETVCRTASAEPAAMLTPTYLDCLALLTRCDAEGSCPR
jgi:hypothetical protein